VRFHKPVVYQPAADAANPKSKIQNRQLLDGRYILTADNRVHFEIPNYDKSRPLVIDPVLVYSTYLGGSNGDSGNGIAVDSSGNAYVAGITYSTDFPTANAFQPANPQGQCSDGNSNYPCGAAFVTKLNAAGTALVYSTYLGGSSPGSGDGASAIAVDSSGNAWVTGATTSTDFPVTANAFEPTLAANLPHCQFQYSPCSDGFVTKLSAAGNSLVYSTYLGGSSYLGDQGTGIAVDISGNAYVTGTTTSCDFPTTTGAFDAAQPAACSGFGEGGGPAAVGFVAKFTGQGQAVYSTYLGGSIDTANASGIAADSSGSAYVTGGRMIPLTPRLRAPSKPLAPFPLGVLCALKRPLLLRNSTLRVPPWFTPRLSMAAAATSRMPSPWTPQATPI